jgi:hypothetical protein
MGNFYFLLLAGKLANVISHNLAARRSSIFFAVRSESPCGGFLVALVQCARHSVGKECEIGTFLCFSGVIVDFFTFIFSCFCALCRSAKMGKKKAGKQVKMNMTEFLGDYAGRAALPSGPAARADDDDGRNYGRRAERREPEGRYNGCGVVGWGGG